MSTQTLRAITSRRREDAAAMTVAVQANLVTLKVAASRRANMASESHAIRTESPGAVIRYRETLLDRQVVAEYSDQELLLRIRQIWGEFSLLCWAFHCEDPHFPPSFAALPEGLGLRCPGEMLAKTEEITRNLWRMQHEQHLRFDATARSHPDFQREHELAVTMRVRVYDMDIRLASGADLIQCACEHAGMLGAIRWLLDDTRVWGEAGIMNIDAQSAARLPPGQ